MNLCLNDFCGCQRYIQEGVAAKVYIEIAVILIIVAVSLRLGSQWFIFKDYYPMKERSPVLCIYMIVIITLQLILYPHIYVYNYFANNFYSTRYLYKILYFGLDGSVYVVYLLRCLRLTYAHEVDASRCKTWIFKMFKHQHYLVLLALLVVIIKVLPIIFNDFQEYQFYTFLELNFFTDNEELGFGIKNTIHQFIWLSIMIYCLWLQNIVHRKYSMFYELLFVIGLIFIFNIIQMSMFMYYMGQTSSVIATICKLETDYPILQMIRDLSFICLYMVSIYFPIFKKRIYHMLLPTGRHHDSVKTMRDFLMEPEFLEIFSQFLVYKNQQKNTEVYTDSLDFWKKLMVIKYNISGDEEQRIDSIKDLIKNIQDKPVKEIHFNLISHLKQSILSLEDLQEQEGQAWQKQKLLQEINNKIQELQFIFLDKLDKIYKQQYRFTKSYYYLKIYLIRNKRINLNMITLKMAVMVVSEQIM